MRLGHVNHNRPCASRHVVILRRSRRTPNLSRRPPKQKAEPLRVRPPDQSKARYYSPLALASSESNSRLTPSIVSIKRSRALSSATLSKPFPFDAEARFSASIVRRLFCTRSISSEAFAFDSVILLGRRVRSYVILRRSRRIPNLSRHSPEHPQSRPNHTSQHLLLKMVARASLPVIETSTQNNREMPPRHFAPCGHWVQGSGQNVAA
jgi:hypothetical protein